MVENNDCFHFSTVISLTCFRAVIFHRTFSFKTQMENLQRRTAGTKRMDETLFEGACLAKSVHVSLKMVLGLV